jgi:propionyl-CoA carboxylase beta chain
MDVLIHPQETRPQIIKALEMLEGKKVDRAERKHGNIPL